MCNRPFENITDMELQLIEKWNNKVNDDDTIYILGDFSFKAQKTKAIQILKKLKGHKILIKGNHDKYVGQRDFDECFDGIYDMLQVKEENKIQITLCHYPIASYPGMHYGAKMIYGHIHNHYLPVKNMYCVSVECINYEPITFEELVKLYENKELEELPGWSKEWEN